MKSAAIFLKRGLRREEAASYVGVGASKFDELVERGDMPSGMRIDGCRIWDVRDLDEAFDMLKGERIPAVRGAVAQWDDAVESMRRR